MNDWDDYTHDLPLPVSVPATVPVTVPTPSSKWHDEEVSDSNASSVADAWDASSDSDNDPDPDHDLANVDNQVQPLPIVNPTISSSNPSTSTPSSSHLSQLASPSKPKKRSIKQAIADRQSQEQIRQHDLAMKRAAAVKIAEIEANESPSDRRARLQRQVEEEDAKHVEDLFGGTNTPIIDHTKPIPERNLLTLTPKTKVEFDDYLDMVMNRFADFEKRMLYPSFVDQLARKLCERMTKLEDIRKVASSLNALANDRQRQDKEAQKKGKKPNTKKQVRVETEDFEDPEAGAYYAGDYDDFM